MLECVENPFFSHSCILAQIHCSCWGESVSVFVGSGTQYCPRIQFDDTQREGEAWLDKEICYWNAFKQFYNTKILKLILKGIFVVVKVCYD